MAGGGGVRQNALILRVLLPFQGSTHVSTPSHRSSRSRGLREAIAISAPSRSRILLTHTVARITPPDLPSRIVRVEDPQRKPNTSSTQSLSSSSVVDGDVVVLHTR